MMKKFLSFFTVLIALSSVAIAQQKTISGQVIDTFNNETLEYATITVLRASDSILLGYARSNKDGDFSLKVAEEKKYLLLITCPGFADYTDVVSGGTTPNLALGKMVLFTREKLLSEFVILQKRGAIIIKGDTTEYVADSFKFDANANVEALLKKLPGLQVDKNGQVTAQGEKVQKILVDGEEFFSDDPAVVNKNLQAKTIDKVQVFDKKSENAEFTGIDDGERIKTINLQLKDKYKKGYFGKLSVGGGTNDFFENQGMFNYFMGKQKFSVYGIAANTGKVGLSFQDADRFGGGNQNRFVDEESGYTISTADDDGNWGGQYNGQGLPKAWTAGAHYSNKWNADKHHVSANYRFNRQNVEAVNNVLTQYSLPDSVYYNDQKTNTFSTSDRHGLTGLYEWKIDSLNTLKFTANASKSYSKSNSDANTTSKGSSGSIINNSANRNLKDGENDNVVAAAIWKKRFQKKGRNLLLELTLNQRNTSSDGYLLATNTFYNNGTADSTNTIDQKKNNQSQTSSVATNVTYTEPISKKGFLELTYRFNNQNNFSRQLSFNKNAA
ncbi:MAG: carboxypeptidase regulatory-like domain-containing protein, partial [Chitinophagaceae bacterium]|nr:carboxypeptidase regulatory-like domain-containing protein [Chitinophagaceae bacterium]